MPRQQQRRKSFVVGWATKPNTALLFLFCILLLNVVGVVALHAWMARPSVVNESPQGHYATCTDKPQLKMSHGGELASRRGGFHLCSFLFAVSHDRFFKPQPTYSEIRQLAKLPNFQWLQSRFSGNLWLWVIVNFAWRRRRSASLNHIFQCRTKKNLIVTL